MQKKNAIVQRKSAFCFVLLQHLWKPFCAGWSLFIAVVYMAKCLSEERLTGD